MNKVMTRAAWKADTPSFAGPPAFRCQGQDRGNPLKLASVGSRISALPLVAN
jgi:hypothetical protein